MKQCGLFLFLLVAVSVFAEELPPAPQILAAVRAQLPPHPVFMSGTLKEWAPNGFMKKTKNVEMDLDWNAIPSTATYRIRDKKTKLFQTFEVQWVANEPVFHYSENGTKMADFDPNTEISGLGVTWADLSFSFLWNSEAKTVATGKKMGRVCFILSVPRPENHSLLIWVERKTGRLLGAEEQNKESKTEKIIKVVSVKDFDGLWMVKDLDVIQPAQGGRTSLRIDSVREVK